MKLFTAFALILSLAAFTNGCVITGVTDEDWNTDLKLEFKDISRGSVFAAPTLNITSILSYDSGKHQKYVRALFNATDTVLNVLLDDAFAQYEENEIDLEMTTNIVFKCLDESQRRLTIVHRIIDTNNHRPVFLIPDPYDIKIFTPLAVHFPIVPIFGTIIIKDVDLTTYGILPAIENNNDFEIMYDGMGDSMKEHKLKILTKIPLESLDEPLILTIAATDRDTTGDPPSTAIESISIWSGPF